MILELILITISTIWFITSMRRILQKKSNSLGDYLMIILYVFNCFPLLLNVLYSKPNYLIYPWYSYFEISANNYFVSNVYNIYVLYVLIVLKIYMFIRDKKNYAQVSYTISENKILNSNFLLYVSFIPIVFVLVFGNYKEYAVFQSYTLRGIVGSKAVLLVFFELLGLFSYFCWFFRDTPKLHSYFWLLAYSGLIIWIDGKRYLIVTIILLFIYFYQNSVYSKRKKLPIKTILTVFSVLFIFIYGAIMLNYKISSTISEPVNGLMYLNFRVDFGRDDVTKFVLYRELIEHNPVLDYRFQTFLSTIFFWIPRFIWSSKPYPHYRYLTAELYGTTPERLHSGITPSIFEMSVANLGVVFGIIFTGLLLVFLVYRADKLKSIPSKVLYLLLLIALLTQSLDAILPVLILIPIIRFFKIMRIRI